MARIKLHSGGPLITNHPTDKMKGPNGQVLKDASGEPIPLQVQYNLNDVFEGDPSLVGRWPEKFQFADRGHVAGSQTWDPKVETIDAFAERMKAKAARAAATPPADTGHEAASRAEMEHQFGQMTVDELKGYAVENEIDLGDAHKKADIIAVLVRELHH